MIALAETDEVREVIGPALCRRDDVVDGEPGGGAAGDALGTAPGLERGANESGNRHRFPQGEPGGTP